MSLFDKDLFLIDVERKQFSQMKHLHTICNEIGISRSTGSQIKAKKQITLDTFFKVIKWMGTDANRYLKK